MPSAPAEDLKAAAAARAVELVRPGMLLGLGTGSTARHFIDGVGRLVAGGMELAAVATSRASEEQARALGIRLLEQIDRPLDLAVDGADEVDRSLNLVKGRGGALFREKVVAAAARRFVVVVDSSKLVDRLGAGLLPVEVLPFLWRTTAARLAALGAAWELRGGLEHPFLTDNGNLVLDLSFEAGIENAEELGAELRGVVGVVEHGLFLGLATGCIAAGPEGLTELGRLG
jgi:ribose 5-phosphate isomerase A